MIDDKFMKRIQASVNRDKSVVTLNAKVALSDVREYVYESWANASSKDEPLIIEGLVAQIIGGSSKLAVNEPSKEENHTLATTPKQTLIHTSGITKESKLAIDKRELIQLAEQEFGDEPQEIKDEIVNHLLSQSIRSARSLKSALAQIRATELTLFQKAYTDHANMRRGELESLRQSLGNRSVQEEVREGKSQSDLNSTLESYLQEFGVI